MMESNLKQGHFGSVYSEGMESPKQARDRLGTTEKVLPFHQDSCYFE